MMHTESRLFTFFRVFPSEPLLSATSREEILRCTELWFDPVDQSPYILALEGWIVLNFLTV